MALPPTGTLVPFGSGDALELAVLCVKWGTKYSADYVNRLRNMVARNLPLAHRFLCLTDDSTGLQPGIEVLPFPQTDLEYCWNKLLLFDPLPVDGVGLFFDLDVVITGDLTPLLATRRDDPFIGVVDWYRRDDPQYNASVMRFHLNRHRYVIESFRRKLAEGRLVKHREWDAYLGSHDKVVYWEGDRRYGGDQEWTSRQVYGPAEIGSHCFPAGTVMSYKKHGRRRLPGGCRVMVFHGAPKPHEVDIPYVTQHWR